MARAHEFRPGVLVVDIGADDTLELRLQLPAEHRDHPPRFILPAGCVVHRTAPTLRASCEPAALHHHVTVHDLAPELELVAHVRAPGQPPRSELLRTAAPTLALTPAEPAALRYLPLGVGHILGGPDHLLFVAGLAAWVRGAARLLATLTAFTAAHSLTLALAALDVVRVPGPPVEACIAVSLVLLARALVQNNLSPGTPWRFAFACGLLHGFGFAGALADIGLPRDAVVAALAAFNLGVELGQIGVAAGVVLLLALVARLAPRLPLRRGLAYAIGGLAFAWTLARVLALGDPA